ncbi:sugar phosphate isomerase/epimerase [Listeria sp. ILCC797]|uniref:sugar phosphate isomerase/epimerase family protein n=1 Tax=Listeria sp. ILCC797 TaxID=1918333 RepID=UPI0015D0BFC0|nr:sugar phosphate isomerase/epimerase [Listeria sp. ILCC797]
MKQKIGLQMWSVKEDAERDFFGTLEKIAEMGYDGVEFAGYYGVSAADLKAKLAELNLAVAGSHIPLERLLGNIREVIDYEKTLGNKHIVCPYADFKSAEAWAELAEQFEQIAQVATQAGMTFSYHNHAHEFRMIDGQYILDFLLEKAPHISLELDTYWAEFAGVSAPDYMEKYKTRMSLVHLKDRLGDESTEIGNGDLNIQSFVDAARKNGTEWLIVEQEAFQKFEPLESIETGFRSLEGMVAK